MKKLLFLTNAFPQQRILKYLEFFKEENYEILVVTKRIDRKKLDVFMYDFNTKVIGNNNKFDFIPINYKDYIEVKSILTNSNFSPDIIFVRDIFMSDLGYKISKLFKSKLVVDIADNYPEVMKTKTKFNLINSIMSKIFNKVEKRTATLSDSIITVTEASKELLIAKHNISPDKIKVIRNFPLRKNVVITQQNEEMINNSIVYIGSFDDKIRDLFPVLSIVTEGKYELYIHSFDKDKIANTISKFEQCTNISLPNNKIHILNPIKQVELISYLKKYQFGLIPHHRHEGTDYTEPNKIYDYIHAGIPVISSNNPSLTEFMELYNVGEVYNAFKPLDMRLKLELMESKYENYKSNININKNKFYFEEQYSILENILQKER